MRRALAWTAGIVGAAALFRWLRARRPPTAVEREPAADPAQELRAAIESSRAETPAGEAVPADAPPEEEAAEASVEERRADVHAKAESAIARMRRDG